MFKLKLTALGHPNPQGFNCEDEKEYRSVILWLEDQKIRHYKIEEREGLRNTESVSWKEAYDTYQRDLVSPVVDGEMNEQLNWLLSYAVRLEYADNENRKYELETGEYDNDATQADSPPSNKRPKVEVTKYKNVQIDEPKKVAPNVISSNPLDNLDFDSPSFKPGVDRICAIAGVGPHVDPKLRIAAVAKILKTAPHPDCPQNDINVVQQPADVFKLLFIQDLRDLQTKINEALVAVQSITADPRTDTSLGKVGR